MLLPLSVFAESGGTACVLDDSSMKVVYSRDMKVGAPQLKSQLDEISFSTFLEGDLEDVALRHDDGTNAHITALDMNGVVLEKVTLTAAQFERINARDIKVGQCDLSAATLTNGAINRAEFTHCRMAGIDFSKTALHDVLFKGCKLDMANFRFADMRRVKYIDCTFLDTDFLGATLHDVSFESCRLERTVFAKANCKSVDLRSSDLLEISGWSALKGATIDGAQLVAIAPYLANELGIVVRNR
jgi:uncharacterized protein YjbI with pentapeptide repeats